MPKYTLLGISGALRKASTNTMLVHQAAAAFAPEKFIFADLRLPLYDADIEEQDGIPPMVQTLADQIKEADAVVISTPEYNKNLPGVLKNALDWVSRTKGAPWRDKPVAIVSAADGRAGGERSQFSLRHCMTPFRPRILQGPEVMIAHCRSAFDENGQLLDERSQKAVETLMTALRNEVDLLRTV